MHKRELTLGGATLSIETGRLAKQASGSVFVRYGDTVVLVTACYAPSEREGIEVVPQERFSDKPPRILFNLYEGKANLVEIVPGELYQNYWQGVRMTVIRGNADEGRR